MAADLSPWLDRDGPPLSLAVGAALRLDDAEGTLWLIRQGSLDVFAARMENGVRIGPRIYLCTLSAGHLLCGVAQTVARAAGFEFLAQSWEPVLLSRVAAADLAREHNQAALAATLAEALDPWLTGVSEGLARPQPQGVLPDLWLDGNESAPLKPGNRLAARRGVVWVETRGSGLSLMGTVPVATDDGQTLLPLTARTWAEPCPNTQAVIAHPTAAVLGVGGWLWRLHDFHAFAVEALRTSLDRAAREEDQRLQVRAERTSQERNRTLARFAALLSETPPPVALVAVRDALYECCARVAIELGLSPGGGSGNGGMTEALRRRQEDGTLTVPAIAGTLGLRCRQVALRGDWWQHDLGPLVAFRGEDRNQPVALLPDRASGRYRLHDPLTGGAQPISDAEALAITPMAFGFYRTFPARAIGLWDMLTFGVRDCGRDLAAAVGVGLAGGLFGMAIPLATGFVFDALIPSQERGGLVQVGLGLFLVALVMVVLHIVGDIALLRVEGRTAGGLQAAVVDRLLRLPASFFAGQSSGDLATRTMTIETIRRTLASVMVSAVMAGLFSVFSFVLLWVYEPRAALVAVAGITLLLVVSVWAGARQLKAIMEGETLSGNIYGLVLQIISGIAKLRLAGAEDRAFVRWGMNYSEMRRRQIVARKITNNFAAFMAGFEALSLAAVFAAIAFAATASAEQNGVPLATGSFLAFVTAFATLTDAAFRIARAVVQVFAIVPLYKRAQPILRALPEPEGAHGDPGRLSGAVEVTSLFFRYPGDSPRVLNGLTLRARPGEFIALVGPSGCGKSTLIKLLLGFERPEGGGIFYDGKDLRHLDLKETRRQIGVVLQNGRLMPGSLYENIKGATDASLDEAWEAARVAGMADDIRAMPMGMHTVLTEGTAALSGGQIQRLLIARAVVVKPRVLILDEATSALDNRTQRHVTESLNRLSVTRIVVAHRVNTIVQADRIYVVQTGRVVESGTYSTLMKANGPFVDLIKRQLI